MVAIFINIWETNATKNYSPTSLLFVINKFFEKLVNNELVDHLERRGLFCPQYGIGSSHSTAHLLTVLSERNLRAFNRSGSTQAVAFDISNNFDRVWHTALFHKLKSHENSSWMFCFI